MAVVWPKIVKTHNLPRLIWPAKSSRGANFSHPGHFARYTSFTTTQLNKNGRWVAKNSQNTHFATFNLARKKFAWRELFSSQPFCTLHVFLTSQLNKNGRCVAKNSQTHNLPRLIWPAKSSRGANFSHPGHFARYTSFTTSQLNKNGRWVAKNSQNTHFATFSLGRKKLSRRELFSSQPFCTLRVFYDVPTKQKWPLCGQKQSKHTICHV